MVLLLTNGPRQRPILDSIEQTRPDRSSRGAFRRENDLHEVLGFVWFSNETVLSAGFQALRDAYTQVALLPIPP